MNAFSTSFLYVGAGVRDGGGDANGGETGGGEGVGAAGAPRQASHREQGSLEPLNREPQAFLPVASSLSTGSLEFL